MGELPRRGSAAALRRGVGDDAVSRRDSGGAGGRRKRFPAVSAHEGLQAPDRGRRGGSAQLLHHGDGAAWQTGAGELSPRAPSFSRFLRKGRETTKTEADAQAHVSCVGRVRYLTPRRTGLCDNNTVEASAPLSDGVRRMNRWAIYYNHGTLSFWPWWHFCSLAPSGCLSWARDWVKG